MNSQQHFLKNYFINKTELSDAESRHEQGQLETCRQASRTSTRTSARRWRGGWGARQKVGTLRERPAFLSGHVRGEEKESLGLMSFVLEGLRVAVTR